MLPPKPFPQEGSPHTADTGDTSTAGPSPWKGLKWLSYTLLSGFVVAAGWVTENRLSEKPSAEVASILRSHPVATPLAVLAFLVLCAALWIFADRKEAIEKIIETGVVFVPSSKLRPDHLSLVSFNPRYVEHAEVANARQELSTQRRLLILGRATGGKTRLAYSLAKESKRYWILYVRPKFGAWKSLNFPRIPYRCNVLWIVDDVNKFVGQSDIPEGERILGSKSNLKIIITCRDGHELQQAYSNKELQSFLERLPSVTCSEFTEDELISLAAQVGQPALPGLYHLTPGSVLLEIPEKRKKLEAAGPTAVAVMKAMFLLRTAFIFTPEETVVSAVLTEIFHLQLPEKAPGDAVETLVGDGLLRRRPSLTAAHDYYLTRDFFDYYADGASSLEHDLDLLGEWLLQHGSASDLQSFGIFCSTRKNYLCAIPYFQKAATSNREDPVLLFQLGVALAMTNQHEQALATFCQVAELDPSDAVALYNVGVTLGQLNRSEEAIQAYEEVARRFGEATEPALREPVAKAMVNKGVALGRLKRSEEEIQACEEVVRRFGEATEPALREPVAKALVNKGNTLARLGRGEEAIQVYEEVVRCFGEATEPALREQVAMALVNKGITLGQLNRSKEAIQVYEEVVRRFGEATEPALREQVAKALVNKGVTLRQLNRSEEAIQVYEEVVRRFGEAAEPALREQVATALLNKGVALGRLNRSEEEIQAYDEVVRRLGEATEPALREPVAGALVNKGVALKDLGRFDKAIAALTEVIQRFADSPEPSLQEMVSIARKELEGLTKGDRPAAGNEPTTTNSE